MRFLRKLSLPSLPLLSKELIEQSNRQRTFVIRTVYALLLYVLLMLILWELLGGWNTNSLAMLGRGHDLFQALVGLQFFAIYAFLPGMTCGVITAEKERDTLAMLMLTKLGGWTILTQKLLSRLMPMGMLMLLSMPLLAVAYSLGGVERAMVFAAVWMLAVTAVQVGSLAVFCSAWFRTTAGAFVATYAIGFSLIVGPILLFAVIGELLLGRVFRARTGELMLWLFGPYVFFDRMRWIGPASFSGWGWLLFVLRLLVISAPIWMTAIVFFILARAVLWKRAFAQPKQRILQFFRWLDGVFHTANQNRFTRGVVLIKESVSLPLFQPISWRETSKKTLGTTRYLIRYLLVVEPPLIFYLLLADISQHSFRVEYGETPSVFPNAILWAVMAISITVLSTGLIAGEKSKQTLDVLLATPLTTRELIQQKLAAVRKLTLFMWIPLLTILAFDFWWLFHVIRIGNHDLVPSIGLWLVQRLIPMVVYPAIIGWLGFHFGLRMRTQGQALLATIAAITAWCVIPVSLQQGLTMVSQIGGAMFGRMGWAVFSPLPFLFDPLRYQMLHRNWGNVFGYGSSFGPDLSELVAYLVQFGFCGFLWYFLRRWAYLGFARVVHRNEGADERPVVTPPASAVGWLSR